MKKKKVVIDEKTDGQIHIVEEHIRKIMSFVDCETALLAAAISLGKYIEQHSVDGYDILEKSNKVHCGVLVSAGILDLSKMD